MAFFSCSFSQCSCVVGEEGVAVSRRSLSGVRNIDTYRSCSPSAANRITKISPFVNTRPGYPHYSHIRSQRVYQIVVMPPCVETRSSSQYIEYLRPGNQYARVSIVSAVGIKDKDEIQKWEKWYSAVSRLD